MITAAEIEVQTNQGIYASLQKLDDDLASLRIANRAIIGHVLDALREAGTDEVAVSA